MSDPHDQDTSPSDLMQSHRAIVRELNLDAQRAYSYGGVFAMGAAGAVLLGAWLAGQLFTVLPWVASPMTFFVSLFFARGWIKRRVAGLRDKATSYCRANEIELDALLTHYIETGDYPFLSSLRDGVRSESLAEPLES